MIPKPTPVIDKCFDCKTPFTECGNAQKYWLDATNWTCLACDIKRRPQREREAEIEEQRLASQAYKSPGRIGNPFASPRVWS